MTVPRLLKQSAVRAGAMVIVKLIGLVGRVILTRIAGAEGIGLYQIAYSFYGFLLMLTGGLPTTLALVTAKKPALGWKFLQIMSICIVLTSGIISLAVFRHSSLISELLGNPGLEYGVRSLAPALFAVPLLGLARGYLQGLNRVGIIALSEVTEQASRIFCMLIIVYHFLPMGIEKAVGTGLYATFIGALVAFILLTVYISLDKTKSSYVSQEPTYLPVIWFFRTSLLISLTRIFIPASEFIDALLVPARLHAAGYSTSEATSMFGIIYGMATIVVYTPTLLTGALSHTVTIQIATEWQQGNLKKFNTLSLTALNICWLWGAASALFLFVHAHDLSFFIFHTDKAGTSIRYLAAIPLIVGVREISTSILWSQDIKRAPIFGLLAGIICATLAQYFLVGIPGFGYIGTAIGILSMELISSIWNLKELQLKRGKSRVFIATLLLDISVLSGSMLGISVLGRFMGSVLPGLWEFLLETCLFFLISGFYIYLRCIRYIR